MIIECLLLPVFHTEGRGGEGRRGEGRGGEERGGEGRRGGGEGRRGRGEGEGEGIRANVMGVYVCRQVVIMIVACNNLYNTMHVYLRGLGANCHQFVAGTFQKRSKPSFATYPHPP